jgi:uncharacterized membrane protein YbaN (DUF454 family)
MKDIAILIFAWILVVLGTAGIFLPFIPGIPLLLAGLIVLARHYEWASRLLARVRAVLSKLSSRWAARAALAPLCKVCSRCPYSRT